MLDFLLSHLDWVFRIYIVLIIGTTLLILKSRGYSIKTNTRLLLLSGFFLALPFIIVLLYILVQETTLIEDLSSIIPKLLQWIGTITLNPSDIVTFIYTVVLLATVSTFLILPIIRTDIDDILLEHEAQIIKARKALLLLSINLFCLSLCFMLFSPLWSSISLAISVNIGFFLFMHYLYCGTTLKYNTRKSIEIIEKIDDNRTKKDLKQFSNHIAKILIDIDIHTNPKMKINNIKTTSDYLNITNKYLIKEYLPLYARDGTEHQRTILRSDLQKICNFFYERSSKNEMVIRLILLDILSYISKYIDENNIVVKESNILKKVVNLLLEKWAMLPLKFLEGLFIAIIAGIILLKVQKYIPLQ